MKQLRDQLQKSDRMLKMDEGRESAASSRVILSQVLIPRSSSSSVYHDVCREMPLKQFQQE